MCAKGSQSGLCNRIYNAAGGFVGGVFIINSIDYYYYPF